jgi:hypothetical protein
MLNSDLPFIFYGEMNVIGQFITCIGCKLASFFVFAFPKHIKRCNGNSGNRGNRCNCDQLFLVHTSLPSNQDANSHPTR